MLFFLGYVIFILTYLLILPVIFFFFLYVEQSSYFHSFWKSCFLSLYTTSNELSGPQWHKNASFVIYCLQTVLGACFSAQYFVPWIHLTIFLCCYCMISNYSDFIIYFNVHVKQRPFSISMKILTDLLCEKNWARLYFKVKMWIHDAGYRIGMVSGGNLWVRTVTKHRLFLSAYLSEEFLIDQPI